MDMGPVSPVVGLIAGSLGATLYSLMPKTKRVNKNANCDIGVFGMGVMGQSLCLNVADNGFTVAAYNRPDEFQARIWGALDRAKKEGRKDGGEMLIQASTLRHRWPVSRTMAC
jgi:hypothetical protein